MSTVLVLSGGGFQGAAIIDALFDVSDLRLVMADCFSDNLNRHLVDRFVLVPALGDRDAFLSAMDELFESEPIDLVLPATAHELHLLAEMREDWGTRGAAVATPPPGLLSLLNDRVSARIALADLGCPVPDIIAVEDLEARLPAIGKPRSGWGGLGHLVIHTREDHHDLAPAVLSAEYVWEPFEEGFVEYSLDFAIDLEGSVSPIVQRRRVRQSGGFAVISDSVHDDELAGYGLLVADWIGRSGGTGLFNLQALRRADGSLIVNDVNPRVGTSSGHSLGRGVNLPLFVCRSIQTDGKKNTPVAGPQIRTLRRLTDYHAPLIQSASFDAIVMDLDDTLLDHRRWLELKLEGSLSALSLSVSNQEEAMRKGSQIIEEGPLSLLLDVLIQQLDWSETVRGPLIEAWRDTVPRPVPLFPDVLPALEWLSARGFMLGLLTDNPAATQKQKVAGIEWNFDAVVYTREEGAEKPSAVGFLAVLDRLNVAPERAVMVGDNPWRDLVGAHRVGFGQLAQICRSGVHRFDDRLFRRRYPEVERRIVSVANLLLLTEGINAASPSTGIHEKRSAESLDWPLAQN